MSNLTKVVVLLLGLFACGVTVAVRDGTPEEEVQRLLDAARERGVQIKPQTIVQTHLAPHLGISFGVRNFVDKWGRYCTVVTWADGVGVSC